MRVFSLGGTEFPLGEEMSRKWRVRRSHSPGDAPNAMGSCPLRQSRGGCGLGEMRGGFSIQFSFLMFISQP